MTATSSSAWFSQMRDVTTPRSNDFYRSGGATPAQVDVCDCPSNICLVGGGSAHSGWWAPVGKMVVPSGVMRKSWPLVARRLRILLACFHRSCDPQSGIAFAWLVGPPSSAHSLRWSTSHSVAGISQPRWVQVVTNSRAASRALPVNSRWVRPRSITTLSASTTTRRTRPVINARRATSRCTDVPVVVSHRCFERSAAAAVKRHKNSGKYVRQTNDRAAEDAVEPGPTKWEADMTAKLISSTVVTVLSADQHA